MKLLFLDIDGVLNGHDWNEGAQSNTLRPSCIQNLNSIVAKTDCKIVLSSAWRYMIHTKQITLTGFGYLLRTHGGIGLTPIGLLERDEVCPGCDYRHRRRRSKWECGFSDDGFRVCIKCGLRATRGLQISDHLRRLTCPIESYVAIDDDDSLEIKRHGHPLVLTDGATGLTEKDARKAIRILLKPSRISKVKQSV